MTFRKDINGLRAIAVIAVVLFHFNPTWVPGGFAGVDVFFVISGFLMTGIIFRGIEQENFSIIKFYVARASRIIPALAFLCLVLLVLGWFYLPPMDYRALGKHVAGSVGFLSNIIYLRESGYFDAVSHEKWLLHTWSLSVEWQFYIIYPLVLITMRKLMPLKLMKVAVFVGMTLGFIFCIFATYRWENTSYYLLSTRGWEMMLGGVAYLYPFTVQENKKKLIELLGILLIIGSYAFISKDTPWPGYFAFIPVIGVFLVIQSQRNDSFVTSNIVFQKIGVWSYSIYLWHWPVVVVVYYFSLNETFTYVGIFISILLGYLSNKYIENIRFKNNFDRLFDVFKYKPMYFVLCLGSIGSVIFIKNGFVNFTPLEYKTLISKASESPYRNKCHINEYQNPKNSCEYFGENISWAILGDSHTVEIAYALAEKLKINNIGLKHFSFSSCTPSFKEKESFTKCSKWYNESINYILHNEKIKNVVLNHRIVGSTWTPHLERLINNLDKLILEMSKKKENVYIFYPIPELPRGVQTMIGGRYDNIDNIDNIIGQNLYQYEERNKYRIDHINHTKYPKNVHLINPKQVFCDESNCFAVKNGIPLYFDDDHPSVLGATKLVDLINLP